MINAVIYKDGSKLVGFEIDGHANYAQAGEDIVCAAVSVLATTTVNSLGEQLPKKPTCLINETQGYLKCMISDDLRDCELETAQIILKTLEIGLKSIVQEYDKYVKLEQRRWTKC